MRNRWIKSHEIDTKVSWNRMDETSSSEENFTQIILYGR